MRRSWKNCIPSNVRIALEGCKDYGKEKHNLSVEQIADRMGLADHWVLYKWINEGRMPINMITPYEHACGINLVSRWLAASNNRLLVEIPSGRNADAQDIQELQQQLHKVTGQLMKFYAGNSEAQETLNSIQTSMESLAWHRGNVQQHAQPQLEL
ncbi:hypothetical protein [Neptuniibacter sp.]|uniref:hypothetical protein n=1 Tax=Neptuniibacter sp. TaxID=1962643 RepID=UPI003B5B1B89